MYRKRHRRSRLRRSFERLPIFLIGVTLAIGVTLFGMEVGGLDNRQMNHVGLQVVSLMILMSVSAISIGSVMQLAGRSAVRNAGIAGIGVGLSAALFMAMFAVSI